MKIGYSCTPDITIPYCCFFLLERKEKKQVQISWMYTSLIRVAPECRDIGGACLPVSRRSWLGHVFIKAIGRKRKLGMVIPYLIYVIRVELCCVASSMGFLHRNDAKLCTPFKVVGVMDRLPCCLTTLVGLTLLSCRLGPHSHCVGHSRFEW
jgi:hypothetical protein